LHPETTTDRIKEQILVDVTMASEEGKTATESAPAVSKDETTSENKEEVKEVESTATFEPVVKLEEVETSNGEEEEEVVYSSRSKLFIFGETLLDIGTGKKSWRERGIGEARILRHKEHQKLRFLMRQEKTMKLIANHAVDPRIVLKPNAGSDRSWVWSAFDFSGGELVETVFALRFPDSDIANEFNEKFASCQKEMESLLAGEDKEDEDGGKETDEATEALSKLKTEE